MARLDWVYEDSSHPSPSVSGVGACTSPIKRWAIPWAQGLLAAWTSWLWCKPQANLTNRWVSPQFVPSLFLEILFPGKFKVSPKESRCLQSVFKKSASIMQPCNDSKSPASPDTDLNHGEERSPSVATTLRTNRSPPTSKYQLVREAFRFKTHLSRRIQF